MSKVIIRMSEQDHLYDYAQRIMNTGLIDMKTPLNGLSMFGNACCITLHRERHYQAELCIFPSGKDIPHHIHPDVDSIEVQITGSLRLFQNGIDMMRGKSGQDFDKVYHKVGMRIKDNVDHNVEVGDNGAVFLSIQHWKNGVEPTHIGHNWKGVTFSEEQDKYNQAGQACN